VYVYITRGARRTLDLRFFTMARMAATAALLLCAGAPLASEGSLYLVNPGSDDAYLVVSIGVSF